MPIHAFDDAQEAGDAPVPLAGPPFTLAPGIVLANKYRLSRRTGSGGMGTVWTALNLATGAQVAIKVLLPEHAGEADAIVRFRHEAHATAQLTHRGIVRVFDLIEFGTPERRSVGIVMELLQGHTLSAVLAEREKLSFDESLEILLPILSALSHAHAAGIVHRDLKPDNVFLAKDPDGIVTPKVLDFGISKQCFAGPDVRERDRRAVGTPGYMSPEQAQGLATVDPRSDLFCIGILLYEMLSGCSPFAGVRDLPDFVTLLACDPERPDGIDDEVWDVLERALAKHPDDRFASATAFAAALQAVRHLFRARRPPKSPRGARVRRSPLPRLYAGVLVGSALLAAVLTTVLGHATRADVPHRDDATQLSVTTETTVGSLSIPAPVAPSNIPALMPPKVSRGTTPKDPPARGL